MIAIEHVDKYYGKHHVLQDCSTHVAKGEVVVVCGPSGSGKSTLIKCVNGLEPLDKGEIVVDGLEVADKANLRVLRTRIGMVFQNFELYPHLSALDNICLAPMVVLKRKRVVKLISSTLLWQKFLAEISVFGVLHHAHNLECGFRLVRRGLAANSQSDRVS